MVGKLQIIELYNFKSYCGKVRVEFGSAHFTSIIGPNGSGKSNMMDAISFVLGIRSNVLRSGQLADLVYRGRVMNHKNSEDAESNEQVASTQEQRSDPKSAYVSAEYVKENGEVLELKRS